MHSVTSGTDAVPTNIVFSLPQKEAATRHVSPSPLDPDNVISSTYWRSLPGQKNIFFAPWTFLVYRARPKLSGNKVNAERDGGIRRESSFVSNYPFGIIDF